MFLAVLVGATTVESPIRGYSEVSWQYLKRFHQPMAGFVGGQWAEDGSLLELGMWEKEERQHSPALAKIYKELTGESLTAKPTRVKPYQPSECPYQDMYRHGLHRFVTEYGATCLYLWLVAHSTDALQQVLVEILLDEINHMTKFFGFGIWAFAESSGDRLKDSLNRILTNYGQSRSQVTQSTKQIPNPSVEIYRTFGRVMELLDWQTWHPISKLELTYTFLRVMHRLWRWRSTLTPEYLQGLLGTPPCESLNQCSL
ncbi:ferritin-like domain-containing protein [Tumidithrix elongata RA019]|uniref:Ferritin-like domain-containing protein n=1 Tax=Tumidithrix elongata BACA0141 TaxID=2716417 RepID=A0AAW9Q732_9CYAN|nr:ferritin-like domain-containing protein [Tumidithrix elongata RA019]